jgi:hypothetical protein
MVEVELPVECDEMLEDPVLCDGNHPPPPPGNVTETGLFIAAEVTVPFKINSVYSRRDLSECLRLQYAQKNQPCSSNTTSCPPDPILRPDPVAYRNLVDPLVPYVLFHRI